MLELKESKFGFKIFFKNYLFLNHSSENPCITIGKGIAHYKSRFGEFKIREKLREKIPLTDYELIINSEEEVKIKLKCSDYSLELLIKAGNEYLEIIPNCRDATFNRFWISIQAYPSEAIYGCGEQYSELNLRGKEFPLWVEEQGIGRGSPPISFITFKSFMAILYSDNLFVFK